MMWKKKTENETSVTEKSKKKAILWVKDYKSLKNGSYSVVISLIVIAAVIVINMIAGQIPSKYTSFDISTGKLYTVGEETKKALKNLSEDITIYHIVQSGNEDSNVEKILEQYEELSKHIKVVKKDPVVYPNFISQYTDESLSDNSLIVVGKERNKVIAESSIYESEIDYSTYQQTTTGFDGEGQITSAIAYITSESLPVVYYVDGHNEVSIPDSLKDRIAKANVELKSLSLLTADEIPEDAAGLLLNSPETDYSAEEAKKVISYLENGGKAMIITDYLGNDMKNYQSILAEYGVNVEDGIVIETDSNKYVQKPYYIVPDINASDISTDMTGGSSYVLLSGCQGFTVPEDVRDTLEISNVLTTSEGAFVKKDPQNMKSYDKEENDVAGPFTVAATISEQVSSAADTSSETASTDAQSSEAKTTQIVCFASSSLLDESTNSMVSDGNYTMYMNSLNWLIDTGDLQNVSIASKSVATQYLTVTAGKAAFFAVILCFMLPIACLIVGGVICYKRKRR